MPLLVALTDTAKAVKSPRRAFTAPFHKEGLFGALGLHVLVGGLMTVVPVYHLVHTTLAEPGQAAYCTLWGC